MRVAVLVREEEFGLAIVSLADVRYRIAEAMQTLSRFLNIDGIPVQPNAFIVLWLDGRTSPLIEHEAHVALVEHAEDEPAIFPHLGIHPEPEAINPQTQASFQIRAGDDGYARFESHPFLLFA